MKYLSLATFILCLLVSSGETFARSGGSFGGGFSRSSSSSSSSTPSRSSSAPSSSGSSYRSSTYSPASPRVRSNGSFFGGYTKAPDRSYSSPPPVYHPPVSVHNHYYQATPRSGSTSLGWFAAGYALAEINKPVYHAYSPVYVNQPVYDVDSVPYEDPAVFAQHVKEYAQPASLDSNAPWIILGILLGLLFTVGLAAYVSGR